MIEDTKEAFEETLDPDGPVEEAGEKIDETIESTREKAREARKRSWIP
jgi:hypothetical protein